VKTTLIYYQNGRIFAVFSGKQLLLSMNKFLLKSTYLLGFSIAILSCDVKELETPPLREYLYKTNEIPIKWGEMTNKVLYQEPNNSPTYASRAVGYMGLTMYESIVNASTEYQSLVGQVNGLTELPKLEAGKEYNYLISMNAAQAIMLKKLYPNTSTAKKASIDSLEKALYTSYAALENPEITKRSVEFGQSIANAIYEYSKTDGGDGGNTRNFEPNYMYPRGMSYWSPPIIGQSPSQLPLHPYWGKNRQFAKSSMELPVPKPIPFSMDRNSDYYKQFQRVYDIGRTLTQEQKEIALWWGDDPTDTYSPPGHSFNIASIVIRKAKADAVKAAMTYARVGMATADAFVGCWRIKYSYHSERPSTYIRMVIDGTWLPFWPEPPFPAFSSGHATQGAAAATVLTDIYGDKFAFIDNTHSGRPMNMERNVAYKSRSFNSFMEFADESAMSRLYGQIHTPQDNEIGMQEGKKIGQNINQFKWKK
jgi:PAP2 superfamily